MRLIANSSADRVIDALRPALTDVKSLDIAAQALSLYGYSELKDRLAKVPTIRLILPEDASAPVPLLGTITERSFRNHLTSRYLAQDLYDWLNKRADIKVSVSPLPQSALIIHGRDPASSYAVVGSCPLNTEGLGLTPGNQLGLIQFAETPAEVTMFDAWFDSLWQSLPEGDSAKTTLLSALIDLVAYKNPELIYHTILNCIFAAKADELDEEKVIKTATGIKNTKVWKKLYRFQRDGVVGAIDKLEKFGGCIIADSVGLGKTFEALAIVKYYELRNDRVLVLCPKRLRDNWTIYTANDNRNIFASDRFNYDVLNHTDLSRDGGISGDIDLSHLNWGNYDLLVIDESHNFRNKATRKDRETRYDRLMRRIIQAGVKTKVLMLSATPVNNRLADLKNQIAFATEGDDASLLGEGIVSIEQTTRSAQTQFNRWLDMPEDERTPSRLLDMLGFDYFKLLDLLTIARSRKHIQKYYGITETGRFPERLKPINYKPDVDSTGAFPAIRSINREIRRLHLAAYAPLRYVLPGKLEIYEKLYGTEVRGGQGFFRQVDREESLIHLLRINVLKRMESAVSSFALTVSRQLADVEAILSRIENHSVNIEEPDITDIDIEDPLYESLLVGRKVKVLLHDVDLVRWRQDLLEDAGRLASLHAAATEVGEQHDAKLATLKNIIESKVRAPINSGNRKVIVFTAFADTAQYLYEHLAPWAQENLGLQSALVTGTGKNQTSLSGLRNDLASILSAFSPRSKERPADMATQGELDLLIATDCISEGQNLQDCDFLVNYDIHWNPVRIIQRFGRIDRIGSINERVQLVNFWPNMELEEYINLEQRVSGKMVLLDISATGEENIIEAESGDTMHDLEYRRTQLLKLQETVIDLEDLSSGVSITDLTLTDFRIDLARYRKDHLDELAKLPLGTFAVVAESDSEFPIQPGVIFCLRAESNYASEEEYPLAPYYLVHVGEEGSVLLPYTQSKQVLDRLKRACLGRELPDAVACSRFDLATRNGERMESVTAKLATAIASVVGKKEERSIESLFRPGGTHALAGEFAGSGDFEVVAFLVILKEGAV